VEWIKKTFGEENQLTVINTHFHRDNLGGNGYLLSQNIPVYGSDLTVKLLEERGEVTEKLLLTWLNAPKFQRFYKALKDAELVAPDHVFSLEEGLQLQPGDEQIEVFYPGPAHSLDNVVVYFPDRKILFGGCMIKSLESKKLGNLADADVAEWPNSAKTLLTHYPEARLVIPGHGNWGDVSLIHHTLALLEQHKK
jgi:glyoxylase-like metal-dependent hydrolase (beta-lactamase superfamily II)